MKIGLALKKGRRPDGHLFRYVPLKPCVAGADDLSKFAATVVTNDPDYQVLTLNVTRVTQTLIGVGNEALQVTIAYPTLQRVRRLSKVAYEPKEENVYRPTKHAMGTAFRPYRTWEEVLLR